MSFSAGALKRFAGALVIVLLPLSVIAQELTENDPESITSDTIRVAPPTGEMEADRASILDALDRARPGGTIQFAPGTYLVGEVISIDTPRLTLLGHSDGTTLRGCEADDLDEIGRAMVATWSDEADPARTMWMLHGCGLFQLTGGHGTVRNLTFEQAWSGLILGCCEAEMENRPTDGGYLIEDNIFRDIINGVRGPLWAPDPTVIRANRFVNTFHALSAFGSRLHVLDNSISVPEPARVPGIGYPAIAIAISGGAIPGVADAVAVPCNGNVVAGNWIEGHPSGINILSLPGSTCRHNEIRENTIVAATPSFDPERRSGEYFGVEDGGSTLITGVPLSMFAFAHPEAGFGGVEETVVEGNIVSGAHGVGIDLVRASGNRIVNNVIRGVERRDPFPGNVIGPPAEWSADINGAGIWVSPGSDRNEIVGNDITGTAAEAIVLEGEGNRVETIEPDDAVRDGGTGNTVHAPAQAPDAVEPADTLPSAVVQHFVDAANQGDPTAMAAVLSPDAVFHEFPSGREMVGGREAIEAMYRQMLEAMPEPMEILIDARIVDGPFVIDREVFRTASGSVPDPVVWMYEVRGGEIVRAWVVADREQGTP